MYFQQEVLEARYVSTAECNAQAASHVRHVARGQERGHLHEAYVSHPLQTGHLLLYDLWWIGTVV